MDTVNPTTRGQMTGFIKGENPAMFAEVASPGKKVSDKGFAK